MAHHSVLVVEDDPGIRESLVEILQCEDYLVSSATNGSEALEYLQHASVRPDVILLDLMMPVMSGWDFLDRRVSDPRLAEIPVIVCSATSDKREVVKATAILRKPIQLKTLLDSVERVLERHRPAS